MTPQEHYTEAENWLQRGAMSDDRKYDRLCVAIAQVHATLATCTPPARYQLPLLAAVNQTVQKAAEREHKAAAEGMAKKFGASPEQAPPEFLEGKHAYDCAPNGTQVECTACGSPIEKLEKRRWLYWCRIVDRENKLAGFDRRRVLRWGDGK